MSCHTVYGKCHENLTCKAWLWERGTCGNGKLINYGPNGDT